MRTLKIAIATTLVCSCFSAEASDQFWKKIRLKKSPEIKLEQVNTDVDTTRNFSVTPLVDTVATQPVIEPVDSIPESINYSLTMDYTLEQVDSLLAEWRERQAADSFEAFQRDYIVADSIFESGSQPDSIYIERLMKLASPVNLPFNSVTKQYIERYINTRYGTINRILSLAQYYFPFIEQELTLRGIPVEFRAMPIIESALSSTAVSRAGAVGLWQFMPATGKAYGLEVNSLVDERRDPVASTKAACEYLLDMYKIYGDWTLVIASYNCGPGNVNKALARSGVKEGGTFWDVYHHLPRETRGYVPAFVGASYAYAYHQQHQIEFEESPLPLATDTLHINRIMHLGQVSETLEIPIETLRELNPQYIKDIIPATKREYSLRLPQQYITKYIEQEEMIHSKDSTYLKEYISPAYTEKAMATPSSTVHRVKSGETLGAIARKYRVSTSSIVKWNNLRNPDRLSVGQRLVIQTR